MVKISVIVPVFNAEQYLSKCLGSILNQTYTNIEVIVINDGSKDASQEIINKYKEEYPEKINCFETENNGVAQARNLGIEKAVGDYFIFVDADDYIELDLIEKLSKIVEKEKIDIVKYKLNYINNNSKEICDGPVFDKVSGEEAFSKLCFTDKMIDTPCLYLFNTEFFKNNSFKFYENTYHEDFGLIPLVIVKAKSFISSSIDGYNYVQVNSSIIRNDDYKKTVKKANDLIIHYDNMKAFIESNNIKEQTKKDLLTYFTNAILQRTKELNTVDKQDYVKQIKKRRLINNIKRNTIKSYIKFIYYKLIIKY